MRQAVRALVVSSILSLVAVTSIYAMDEFELIAKVPFSFTAGEKSLPAGDYTFTVDDPELPTLLTVQSKNGEKDDLMLTESKTLSKAADESKLVFEKIGNRNYLSEVWVAGLQTVQIVPQTDIQKEAAQNAQRHETVNIAARKR